MLVLAAAAAVVSPKNVETAACFTSSSEVSQLVSQLVELEDRTADAKSAGGS